MASTAGSSCFRLILSIAILLRHATLPANGAQMRKIYVKKIFACDGMYGKTIARLTNVRSFLTCANKCSNTILCLSMTYDPNTKLCTLNSMPWITPDTTGCPGNTVFYSDQMCASDYIGCTKAISNVRLCDGGGAGVCNTTKGRLEVYYNNTWGTVCDDLYNDLTIENVVCSMLGYTNGKALYDAPYGPGVDPIWMDDVDCVGNETTLLECPQRGWGEHNCGHYEDLGIVCFG